MRDIFLVHVSVLRLLGVQSPDCFDVGSASLVAPGVFSHEHVVFLQSLGPALGLFVEI